MIEVKDASKSFKLEGRYLADLHRNASRRGLGAVLVVDFANGYTARIVVQRRPV